MLRSASRLLGVLAWTWFGVAVTQGQEVVPVIQEPRHRTVLESGSTRILDVQIPPGDTTLFHTHDAPLLTVSISFSPTRTQAFGGEWIGPSPNANRTVGRIGSSTNDAEHLVTHRVNNVGDTLFRLIGVINKSAGNEAATDQGAGFAGTPELLNRWFGAYRVALARAT